MLDGNPAELVVTPSGSGLRVRISDARDSAAARRVARATLTRMFGLDLDLSAFYRLARTDPRLDALVRRFRGVKPPRFPTAFEALINGISCQQLSLSVGIVLLNRLAGACAPAGPDGAHAFPRPEDLASASPRTLWRLGYSHAKVRAMRHAARLIADGKLDLESLVGLEREAAIERLEALPGVGRWTAEYVLLRGLGRIDVFPGDDVGARTHLEEWLRLRKPLDYERVRRLLRRWHPYGGLIYFHMLLDGLASANVLDGTPMQPEKEMP
jgi:DNA-3-methyladenine glycosylase II